MWNSLIPLSYLPLSCFSTEQCQLAPAAQGQIRLLVRKGEQRESVQPVNFEGKKGHRVSQFQGLDTFFSLIKVAAYPALFSYHLSPKKSLLPSAWDVQHLNQNYSEEISSPPVLSAEPFNIDTALSCLGRYRFIKGGPIPISSSQHGTCSHAWSQVCWDGSCTHHLNAAGRTEDIRERKDIQWSAASFERDFFCGGLPTWTSVHCAASVHIHSLSG